MSKRPTSERGSYRGIYETLYDDLDFQRLSPIAKVVWHVLKVRLTQYGIAVFYPEPLPRIVNASAAEVDVALAELERPKPGQKLGWLVREEHVFWLVNGFRFDPSVSGGLSENHKTGARRYAETLPKLDVVRQFLAYYGLEATASKPVATPAPTIGRDSPSPTPTPTPRDGPNPGPVGGNRESETESDTESDSEMGTPPSIPGLPAAAARFVDRFYGSAAEGRRQEVIGQLRATISEKGPGARVKKGVHAKARDLGHLEGCCLDVIEDPPNNGDVAIVWVLKKLLDPILDAQGRTVTEAASDHSKREAKLFDLYHVEKAKAGREWARLNPDRWAELQGEVDRKLGIPSDMPMYETMRRTQLAEAAGIAAGFPSFDDWRALREVSAA